MAEEVDREILITRIVFILIALIIATAFGYWFGQVLSA